jgi:peptidoglycan-associated lipoprotein
MKIPKWRSVALLSTMMIVAGCSKAVMEDEMLAHRDTLPTALTGPGVAENSPDPESRVRLAQPDAHEIFLNQMVFFDFDSDKLTLEAQTLLQRKSQWLRKHPGVVTLLIEGHCDARGTDAYNMALGERRAQAVKAYLIDLGVAIDSLETRSYGEEKPFVQGNGEKIWAKNRRASFVIQ